MAGKTLVAFAALLLAATCVLAEKPDTEEDLEATNEKNLLEAKIADACREKKCKLGHECTLDEDGHRICVCASKCHELKPLKVCSTQNETFPSECDLDRERCLCHRGQEGCQNKEHKKAHLDYYGECKDIPECTEGQMRSFSRRMSEWLFQVMKELSARKDLTEFAEKLAEEAKSQPKGKHSVIPVIWKFCDLDKSKDKSVNRRELLPLTSMLKPLEHCLGPFLDTCAGDDRMITLGEWGTCLGLEKDDVNKFEDLCDKMEANLEEEEEEDDEE
ncbi:SPARC [Lingula anatina]|uniref:SPARC n=1 Tax=Lingula anatina TaxID=7574 RepID=A0A1S3I864_LINAN|nr:SPARC [Lingula anatina]|eukprot:XP_013394388.1 SPARC [Lingula anatina]